MKKWLLCACALFVTGAAVPASAGGYGWGHGYGGWYGYGLHYGHGGYRYGYRGHNNRGAYLLGGVLLGALITDTYYRRDRYPRVVERAYPSRAVTTYRSAPLRPVARHLYRDLAGNCSEIVRNDAGDEMRVALAPGDCAW